MYPFGDHQSLAKIYNFIIEIIFYSSVNIFDFIMDI